ncbi:MAG: alginate lyase family protein [Candidatus Zixiibacteriota bacterium]
MKPWVYTIKIRQKLRGLGRKYRRPVRVLSLSDFFKQCWEGALPDSRYFSARRRPFFFFDPSQSGSYIKAIERYFPGSISTTLERADRAVRHRFDLLGSGETFLGDEIDWHVDFKSAKRWPCVPHTKIRIVNLDDDADVKVPWELSRLQHFTDLGRAYWMTSDQIYRDEFLAQLMSWEKSNPVDHGVNWTCSMEIAIRAINILWGMYFFSRDDDLNTDMIRRVIRLLYYHGLHIEKNLEITGRGSNTNHLVSNYLGLFYLGLMLPRLDRASDWLDLARKGLEEEIQLEVFEDGADYECSTSYHRLVLDMFLSAYVLGNKNGVTFSDTYQSRLNKMIDFSTAITAPSGKTPLVGDNDDGFVVKLSNDDPSCHHHLIDVGLATFERKTPGDFPVTEERLWYLGPQSLERKTTDIVMSSKCFSKSGYAIIRNEHFHLMFSAAKVTDRCIAGHKHNDNLSFTLEIDNIPYLIDPGTSCYTSDFEARNSSRSTGAHNTVGVDEQEQSRFYERRLFHMFNDAKAKVDLWINGKTLAVVSATHEGYTRLDNPVTHRRTIWAFLDIRSVSILDEFYGKEGCEHTFSANYLTPITDIRVLDNSITRLSRGDDRMLNIGFMSEIDGELSVESAHYYPRYGVKAPARLIRSQYKACLPFRILTLISDQDTPVGWWDKLSDSDRRLKMQIENTEFEVNR